jgi:hypothetical protein
VFRPGLLSDPRCAILACRQGDAIIADAIVYAAGRAAGISNLFSTGLPPDRLWAGVQQAVAGLRPYLPVVGYEEGASLEAARQAGFRVLGTLRVWSRLSPAPSPAFLPRGRHQPPVGNQRQASHDGTGTRVNAHRAREPDGEGSSGALGWWVCGCA